MATMPVHSPLPTPLTATVEERLRKLEAQWKADTQFLSDPERIIDHAAFQEIIGLGDEVVPRQLPTGRWTSKLGQAEDIEHDLRALEGEIYRAVALILKRPVAGA